jgi:hypothetical protein
MHILGMNAKAVPAIAPTIAVASGAAWTAVEVNATGYDRVCYVINFGAMTTGPSISELEVQEATSTGGTFTNLYTATETYGSAAISTDTVVVDVPVTYTSPFQKLMGTMGTDGDAATIISAVAVLYHGTKQRPVAQSNALSYA